MALQISLLEILTGKVFITNSELFLVQILRVDEINRVNFMDFFPRRHPPLIFSLR